MHARGGPDRADVVRRHVAAVAEALITNPDDVLTGVQDVLAGRIEELASEADLLVLMRASIRGNLDTILESLRHDIRIAMVEPPTAAFEYARRLAQRGVPLTALVRGYRLGQQSLLQHVLRRSQELPEEVAGVRAEAGELIVQEVSDYIDWISQRVIAVYEDERASWSADPANARGLKVHRLLEDGETDLDAAELQIGYPLRGHHVAVVAGLDPRLRDEGRYGSILRRVDSLAADIGTGRPPLVVRRDRVTAWAWIQVPEGWRYAVGDAAAVRDEGGPAVALGSCHRRLEGFRRSHAEARRVYEVQLRRGPGPAVLSHDEPGMAVAALLVQDLSGTRAWVQDVLGGLAAEGEAAQRSRETLTTFLRHQGSFAATAAAMQMHRNSIRYRVASAERLLGRSIADDRLDVELALTVCAWLGPAVLE